MSEREKLEMLIYELLEGNGYARADILELFDGMVPLETAIRAIQEAAATAAGGWEPENKPQIVYGEAAGLEYLRRSGYPPKEGD